MKKIKWLRLVIYGLLLIAAVMTLSQLADGIAQKTIFKSEASIMEMVAYGLFMLGLIGINLNLQDMIRSQKVKLSLALGIPVVCVVCIFFINNYLHYLYWNSLPSDNLQVPFSYFLKYDITYTIGIGKFRYIGILGIMLLVCLAMYFVIGGGGKGTAVRKLKHSFRKKKLKKMANGSPRLKNIETEHFLLRGPTEEDLQVFLDIERKFDEHGMTAAEEGIIFCGEKAFELITEEYLMGDMDGWVVAFKDGGRMAGYLHIKNYDKFNGVMDLSLSTIKELRGDPEGVAEIIKAGIAYAFTEDPVNRVTIEREPSDQCRRDAFQVLGLHHDGTMRESVRRRDGFKDIDVYSILRKEYSE